MPVKERLSSVSIETLTQVKPKPIRITIQEDILSSKPFIIPKRKSAEAKFTGRQRELDYLRTLYSETIVRIKKQTSSGEVQYKPLVAAIKGEAGIGKSRLVKEFLFRVSSATGCGGFISGGSYSSGQNTYGLVSNLLKNSLGLSGKTQGNLYYSEAYPQVKAKASALSQDNIAQLTKLICGQITEQNRIAANNAVKEYLFTFCGELNKHNNPLVITLEDMQWADEPSLEAIEHILKSINLFTETKQPQILFILNYRSGFKPSKTLRAESDYREIILEGFNEKETEQLVFSLAGNKTLNAKTKEEIFKRSDGNPFNIEEWFGMFAEGKNRKVIPETVRSLLAEKVSSLETGEKAALIAASVLGRKFELEIVNEILKQAGKEQATEKIMQSLAEKRYLVNLTGDVYEFRHDILQETIYRYLNTNTRRNAHLLAGIAIEALYPNRLNDYYYELARHYTEAKSESKSLEYLEKAGDKAKNNYEHERAIRYYKKLLQKATGRKRYDITFKLCDVYMNRSEWNKQIELCKDILAESLRLDKNIKAECYKRIGHAYRLKGDYKDALKVYKKVYVIYKNFCDANGKLDIIGHEAKVIMDMGKYQDALKVFEIMYTVSQKEKYLEQYKNAITGLGIVHSKIGNYNDTIKYNIELYNYGLMVQDRNVIITSKINMAQAYYFLGDYTKAYRIYKDALRMAIKNQNFKDQLVCKTNLGAIDYAKRRYKTTIVRYQNLINNHIYLGDRIGLCRVYGMIGACFISMGNYTKALSYLSKQLTLSKTLQRKQSHTLCLSNIGAVYSLTGNFERALQIFKQQEIVDRKINNLEGIYRAKLNLSMAYYYSNRYYLSEKYARQAITILKQAKIGHNSLLAFWHLARILFDTGCYKESKVTALIASKIARENNYTYIVTYLKILLYKISITHIINSSNGSIAQNASRIIKKIIQILNNTQDIEEIALVNYELWRIRFLNKDLFSMYKSNKYRKTALKYYRRLYKKNPQYEFKIKIGQLQKY